MTRRDRLTRVLAATLAGALVGGVHLLEVRGQPESGGAEGTGGAALEEALRLSELGRLHYDGGEFAEAGAAFARAFELQPEPVLGYNAARSYENAGEPEEALALYQAVLALDFEDPAMRQRCRDGVQRIENILARLEAERLAQPARLGVESAPAGASVLLDGERQGETPLELSLAAGTYVIDLELAGRDSYRETITLEPGQFQGLRVNLPESPQPPEPPDEGGPTWWAVGLTGGVGVLCLAIGAGAALGAHDRFDSAQTVEVQRDEERFDNAIDDGESLRRSSTFFYGLGLAALATAVLLYFVTDDRSEDIPGSAAIDVRVGLGADGAAAIVGVPF